MKRLVTQHGGTLDDETFADEVTVLATFPLDNIDGFRAALTELTNGSVETLTL